MRVDSPSSRSTKLTTDARKRYTGAHWGNPSTVEYEWADAPADLKVTEMGKVVEVTFVPDDTPDGEEPREIGVIDGFQEKEAAEPDILCFSPKTDERLYLALSGPTKAWIRKALLVRRAPFYWLQDVADEVGGRQARFPAWEVRVQRIGPLYTIAYFTDKVDDGPSTYEHEMGEWGGVRPELCVDEEGLLHLAGGSYTVPHEGITR